MDLKGCKGEKKSRERREGLQGTQCRETGTRVAELEGREGGRAGEKLKETDVENHLGMAECGCWRWQLERKSLEI